MKKALEMICQLSFKYRWYIRFILNLVVYICIIKPYINVNL